MRYLGIKKSIALPVMFSVLGVSWPAFADVWISGKNLIIPRTMYRDLNLISEHSIKWENVRSWWIHKTNYEKSKEVS